MDSLLARRLLLIFLVAFVTAVPFVYSQNPLYVSVATNKTQFSPGETVSISGQVRNSQNNPVSDALVSVQVNNPQATPVHVQLLYSNESGTYSDNFVLPSNSAEGLYAIFVAASKPGFDNGQAQVQFNVIRQSASTTSQTSSQTTSPPLGRCFIATATYGSELSPEVALLRNFRDTQVLQTQAGRSFMWAFNGFYYSFSPQVANIISSNDYLRTVMKSMLYPMLAVLYVSHGLFELLSFNQELAVTVSGIFAGFGIGFIYLGPISAIPYRLFKLRPGLCRWALTRPVYLAVLFSVVTLFFAELSHLEMLLSLATVSLVLSSFMLGIAEFPA